MKYKIGVVTGTRAEYGILKPLISRINNHEELELCLIVTGSHLEEDFGLTYKEIENDGFSIEYRIPMDLNSDSKKSIVKSMSKELNQFGDVLETAHLDMMIVLGDRYEILIATTAAMIFNIPIVHIHGGELTKGAIDDSIRHSISKMSYLHFAATKEYADRIIQMGEEPSRVFNVGALGVENIKNCKLLSRTELIVKYSQVFEKEYIMVTFHPVTLGLDSSKNQFLKLLKVIDNHKEYNYVFTYANADADGREINLLIDEYVGKNKNCIAYKSMGQIGYLSGVKNCKFVLGNSSSGIIEVPSFGKATINIGSRQDGRIKANSVIDCECNEEEIENAFNLAKNMVADGTNPYEGINTSEEMLGIILDALHKGINICKDFYDMEK